MSTSGRGFQTLQTEVWTSLMNLFSSRYISGLDCTYNLHVACPNLLFSAIRHSTPGLQREKSHAVPVQTGAASVQSQVLQTEQ